MRRTFVFSGLIVTCMGWGGVAGAQALEVDGSSTLFPVTSAVVDAVTKTNPDIQVNVSQSSTGSGLERFCAGEIAIADASRPIKPEEVTACEQGGVEFIELPVAADAVTVVANPSNMNVSCLTVPQLQTLFKEGGATTWADLDASWQPSNIKIFAPAPGSGTRDFFDEVVLAGEPMRGDTQENDDMLKIQQQVEADPNGLGLVGFSYFIGNPTNTTAVSIDAGQGYVWPSEQSILDGSYQPLTRPLFIYVNSDMLASDANLKALVTFFVDPANSDVIYGGGAIPFASDVTDLVNARLEQNVLGSAFSAAPAGQSVAQTLGGK